MLVTWPIIPSFLGNFFVGSLNTESFSCLLAGGFHLGIPVAIHRFWAFSLLTTYFLCIYSVSSSVLNPTNSVAFSALLYNIVSFVICMLICFSRVWLFVTSWTAAHQAPLPMGLSRQEYWGGLPFPSAGDVPHPGLEPGSPTSPALAGGFFTAEPPGKSIFIMTCVFFFLFFIVVGFVIHWNETHITCVFNCNL